MSDQQSDTLGYARQEPPPPPTAVPEEETRGFCGWAVFAPQGQTWLGFLLAWVCVAAIILLTWLFARIGA